MRLRTFLVIATVAPLFFGLGLLLAPVMFLQSNGIAVNDSAVLFARSVGCVLLGLSVINWFARKDVNSVVTRGIMYGNIVLHALATIVDGAGARSGVITKNPWFGIIVHLFFIVGFGYFLMPRKRTV